MFVLMQT